MTNPFSESGSGLATYLYAQIYNAIGALQGAAFRVGTYSGNEDAGTIATLNDGDFVITWESEGQDGNGYGIYAQRYDANGDTCDNLVGDDNDNILIAGPCKESLQGLAVMTYSRAKELQI